MADFPTERAQVFISYSHKDADHLKRLQQHLKPYIRDGSIQEWDDTQIEAGADWLKEIERATQRARVAVLLVSVDFLASDFVAEKELPSFLEAAEEQGARILPVIIGTCDFTETRLSRFQAVNAPTRPLKRLSEDEQDEIWVQVVKLIRQSLVAAPAKHTTARPEPPAQSPPAAPAPAPQGGSALRESQEDTPAQQNKRPSRAAAIQSEAPQADISSERSSLPQPKQPSEKPTLCPNCGAETGARDRWCINCGFDLLPPTNPLPREEKKRSCPSCGTALQSGDWKCRSCGAVLSPPPQPESDIIAPADKTVPCPRCHAMMRPGDLWCRNCGVTLSDVTNAITQPSTPAMEPRKRQKAPIVVSTNTCHQCGKALGPGDLWCRACGAVRPQT